MAEAAAAAWASDGRRAGLYAGNAFRVLGLGAGATDTEVRRRARERQLALELDGADPDAIGEIRDALATIQEPVARLRAELWWIRLAPDPAPADLDPADARGFGLTVNRLSELANGRDPLVAADARHDLAVLLHASALEDPRAGADRHREALTAWSMLLADETYWQQVTARALQANDPRLDAGAVAAARSELPARILEATAHEIAAAVERGDDAFARQLLAVMDGAPYPSAALAAARKIALEPLIRTMRAATRDILTRVDAAGAGSPDGVEATLSAIWQAARVRLVQPLDRLRGLAGMNGDSAVLADEIAELLDRIATRFINDAKRPELALAPSGAAIACAASESVRDRLRGELRQVREIACVAALHQIRLALEADDLARAATALADAEPLADGDDLRTAVVKARAAIDARRRRRPEAAPAPSPQTPGAGLPPNPTIRMDNPFTPRRPSGGLSPRLLAGAVVLSLVFISLGFLLVIRATQSVRAPATPVPQPAIAAQPVQPATAPVAPVPSVTPIDFPPAAQPPPTIDTRTLPAQPAPPTPAPTAGPPPTLEPVLARAQVRGGGIGRVRLRTAPSLSSPIIDGLDDGEQLDVTDEPREADNMRWVRVRTRNGTRGYVALEYLALAGATPQPAPTATVPAQTPPTRAATSTPTPAPVFTNPVNSTPAPKPQEPRILATVPPLPPTPRPAPTSTPRPPATSTPRPAPTATRTAPTRTPTPRPAADDPETFKGNGASRTRRFKLSGGDYVISWRVQASGGNPAYSYCRINGELTSTDDTETWGFESTDARPTRDAVKGDTRAHNVPRGDYFFEIDDYDIGSSCSWEITIAPDRRR